jgi:hypothetical protein
MTPSSVSAVIDGDLVAADADPDLVTTFSVVSDRDLMTVISSSVVAVESWSLEVSSGSSARARFASSPSV